MWDWLGSHDIILFFQKWSHPALDSFFLIITQTGDSAFLMMVLAYLFWCGDSKTAVRLATIFLLSTVAVYFLKDYFSLPRPDPSLVRTFGLDLKVSESFPSGHATGATIFWGYLAWISRKRWVWWASAFMIAAVSLSRVYLGVHFLRDIVGGILLGVLFIAVFYAFYAYWDRHRANFALPLSLGLAVILPFGIALFFSPHHRIAKCMGMLMGVWVGYLMEKKCISFEPHASAWTKGLRIILGFAGGGLLYFGLKALPLAKGWATAYAIYGVLGLYLSFLYPCFLKSINKSTTGDRASPVPCL